MATWCAPVGRKGAASNTPICFAKLSASRCLVRMKSILDSPEWDMRVAPCCGDQLFRAITWRSYSKQESNDISPCWEPDCLSRIWNWECQQECAQQVENSWSLQEYMVYYFVEEPEWCFEKDFKLSSCEFVVQPDYSRDIDLHQEHQLVWRPDAICNAKYVHQQLTSKKSGVPDRLALPPEEAAQRPFHER